MKKNHKILLAIFIIGSISFNASAQENPWLVNNESPANITKAKAVARLSFPKEFKLFSVNIEPLRQELFSVTGNGARHSTVISLPNAAGNYEQFEVFEASNFEPDLQAQFPQIRAFSGKGISDKYATLKLSISPQGIQAMVFRTGKENEFIEPYSQDHTVYAVFRSHRTPGQLPWTCSTEDRNMVADINAGINKANSPLSSAGELRTMRLAQSVTAEYSNYFGAANASQVALVLAAINATLTRCNGCYEKDLALHLNLIAATTNVIYYNAATDPYDPASTGAGGTWNAQLQSTLTSVIGEANYDIGHLFGASGGGGNAGCIGCVCTNGSKGSGFTSPADGIPQGDNFDIDYVVHEVGHQLGANHTFSMSNEGTGVNKEIGSGITIMGYAGITAQDVAPHSIDIYHEASIAQIQTNLAGKACPVTTNISANNATPVVAAVSNYTIPKSTPFALTGSATDVNGDALTYCWEQNDNASASQTGANSVASATKATGPNWISFSPTTSPTRYFPKLATILAGALISGPLPGGDAGTNTEALSSVARTLNFRLTVRDNCPYSSTAPLKVGQTSFTDMVVTVSAASGPFAVSIPNAFLTWAGGSTQTITWAVASTTAAPVSCANVKISLSTDGGQTFPTVITASTPNDGTEALTIPNIPTTTARIKVEAVGNIFFDISDANFTITSSCPTITATSLAQTNVSCNGGSNGAASVNPATGGTGPYTYNWTPGNPTGDGTTAVTGLTAGTWTCTVTDANLCTGIQTFNITQPAAVAAPTITSPVNYCQGATASALTATGTGLLWYAGPSGGTGNASAPTPSTASAGTTAYYVSQTVGGCESPRAQINVVVTAIPSAPTVTSPVTYCQGVTAVALTATGTGLLWYTGPSGGSGNATAPTPSTASAGTTAYYVSQSATGCEGPRAQINVVVNATPVAPTVSSPLNYCQGATASPLTATGTNLLWYTTPGSTATLINESFDVAIPLPSGWAQQNLGTPVGTTAWFQGISTTFSAQNGAANSYIGADYNSVTGTNTISNWLFAPNIILTNGDVLTFWTRTSTGTYPDRLEVRMSTNGSSVNAGATNASVGDFTNLLLTVNPSLTTVGYPVVWTQYSITISGLGAPTSGRIAFRYFVTSGGPTGANSEYIGIDNVLYTNIITGNPTAPTPSTAALGTTSYYVSQSLTGCEGPRAQLDVVVNAVPTINTPSVTQPTCAVATGSITVTSGAPAGLSYSIDGIDYSNTTGIFPTVIPGNYNVTAKSASGCVSAVKVAVVNPQPLTPTLAVSNIVNNACHAGNSGSVTLTAGVAAGPYTYTIVSGPTINTTGQSSGIFTGLLAGNYTFSVQAANSCTSSTTGATVTEPPGVLPNISLGSDFETNFFAVQGSGTAIVYNIAEIDGNPATGDTIRIILVPGYSFTFDNTATGITIGSTFYTLDNSRWKLDNTNPSFASLIFDPVQNNTAGTLGCQQRLYVSVNLTRNTVNASTFSLSSRLRKANNEVSLGNNLNSIVFTAE